MSPRSPQQFQETRERSRDNLMRAALEMFARYGYHGTSVGRIAEHAGVSKGLVYNYFGSKEELLDAVIVRGMEKMNDILRTLPPADDLPSLLEQSLMATYESMKRDRTYWRLFVGVFTHTYALPRVHARLKEAFAGSTRAYTELLEAMGVPDAELESLKIGALMDGIALQFLFVNDDFPVEQVVASVVHSYRQPNVHSTGSRSPRDTNNNTNKD